MKSSLERERCSLTPEILFYWRVSLAGFIWSVNKPFLSRRNQIFQTALLLYLGSYTVVLLLYNISNPPSKREGNLPDPLTKPLVHNSSYETELRGKSSSRYSADITLNEVWASLKWEQEEKKSLGSLLWKDSKEELLGDTRSSKGLSEKATIWEVHGSYCTICRVWLPGSYTHYKLLCLY